MNNDQDKQYTKHYSVLLNECLHFLTENKQEATAVFADLTFGGGGHTSAILRLSDNYKVYATDQDPDALLNGQKIISENNWQERLQLIESNFVNFPELVNVPLDGIVMDLGVSSHHFDQGERGFSYRMDAPLDMRMDYDNDYIKTAGEIVNEYSEKQLAEIFLEYGEERLAHKIARKIVEERKQTPIKTTKELENIIFHCYPKEQRYGRLNPATRVFQALRIVVNRELEVLEEVLPRLLPMLKIGGRIAVISFHSLEDRIVKHAFKAMEDGPIPCQVLTKKPVLPSEKELEENSRSRSAKLRVLERVEYKTSGKRNKYRGQQQQQEED